MEIIEGIKLEIIGWDRRYNRYESEEARLVYRGDKMMLWISKKIPRPEPYQPKDVIAIDVNEKKIVYGDDKINKEKDTKIDEAHIWKLLAESLQKKYSSPRYPAWRRRKATSSGCPKCDSKLEENGYRRLKMSGHGFYANRDIIGKLNIRKKALKMLGIKVIPGVSLTRLSLDGH